MCDKALRGTLCNSTTHWGKARWLRRRYFRSSMPKEKLRLSFCILLAYSYLWLRRRYFRSSMPKEKLRLSFCILLAYSYLCRRNSGLACRWPPIGGERKVRATQGIPLPNGKRLARVRPCRREQPPKQPQGLPARVRRRGKSPPGPW